jgi:nucleoside-diphosphate-sugar epimerase
VQTVLLVVSLILEISNSKSQVIFSNEIKKGEVLQTKADVKKIKKELKWNHKISLRDGIEKIINRNKVVI